MTTIKEIRSKYIEVQNELMVAGNYDLETDEVLDMVFQRLDLPSGYKSIYDLGIDEAGVLVDEPEDMLLADQERAKNVITAESAFQYAKKKEELEMTRESILEDLGFTRGEVIGIAGKSGNGKSNIITYIVTSLLLDQPLFGWSGVDDQNKDLRALYLDSDGWHRRGFDQSLARYFGEDGTFDQSLHQEAKERFRYSGGSVILSRYDYSSGNLLELDKIYQQKIGPYYDPDTMATFDFLRNYIRTNKIDILVIDSLAGISKGVDENSAAMGQVINNIADLAQELNVLVFLLIHASEKTIQVYRGSTAIRGALSSLWAVEMSDYPGGKQFKISNEKGRSEENNSEFIVSSILNNFTRKKSRFSLGPIEKATSYCMKLSGVCFGGKKYNVDVDGNITSTRIKNKTWVASNANDPKYIMAVTNNMEGYDGEWLVLPVRKYLQDKAQYPTSKSDKDLQLLSKTVKELKVLFDSIKNKE